MQSATWNETNWKGRFFTIWGGQAVSLFGSRLVQFALIWWLTKETGSATVLATASLVGFLPQVVLGPIVGTLVDRWNRRWVMVTADSFIAAATLVLAFLFAAGNVEIWTIYILLFVRSLGGAFHWPSMSAATSMMVPRDQLTRMQGVNQMLQGALGIISAPLGALLVEFMPTQSILMIDVVTASFAIFPLLFISIPEPEKKSESQAGPKKPSFWNDFRAGFAYMLAWPGLLALLGLAMLINFLLNPAAALIPLLVTDHYGGGAIELGWLEGAFGLGMLVGGIILSVWGGFKKKVLTSLTGLIGLGVFFSFLGLLPQNAFLYAIAAAFSAAVMIPIVNGPIHAIVQAAVEPEMQGRVFTLMGSLSSGMAPLGLIIAGPLADSFGVPVWFVVSGVVCTIAGISAFFIPAVMNVEENQGSTGTSTEANQVEVIEAAPA